MSDLDSDALGYIAEMSRRTGARQPATLGEVWSTEWKRAGLDTIGGLIAPYDDARSDLIGAIESASGMSIGDYAAARGIALNQATSQADDFRMLGDLADTLPDDARRAVEPLKDIRLNAARKAQKIEAAAAEAHSSSYGLTAAATAFIAGVARQAIDPVNLAAMVATAPLGSPGVAAGGGLARVIGREALANAAGQAIVEPVIEPARAQLGLDAGLGRAAGNILEAGVGGAALSGLFHVAGRGLRTLRGDRPAAEAVQAPPQEGTIVAPADPENRMGESGVATERPFDPPSAGPLATVRPIEQFAPEDFTAAAHLAERDHVIDAMSPIDTAPGQFDHAAKVQAAAERIDMPQRISVGPASIQTTPLSGTTLWHETSSESAARMLVDDLTNSIDRARVANLFVTDNRDIAIGQAGKGVRIEFDGNLVSAVEHRKPGTGELAGREYRTNTIGNNAITAIEIAPGEHLRLTPSWEARFQQNFERSELSDGTVRYQRKETAALSESAQVSRAAARIPVDPNDVVTQEIKPKAARGRAAADPKTWSLFEYLAANGGLAPHSELEAIFGSKKGPFVPGFGPLIRKKGRTLDDAFRLAKEGGYVMDAADITGAQLTKNFNVLLRMIDEQQAGRRQYRMEHVPEAKVDAGEEAHVIIGDIERELFETGGGDVRVDPEIANRVVEIVQREGETDLLSAYERAIMEDAERYEELAAARSKDAELQKIPGWDVDDAGAAPRDGAPDPSERRQARRAGQGEGGSDGEASRDAGASDRAPRKLGDPALAADARRAMDEAGGDLEITLENPDGTTRTLKASEALREVEDDARAADELNACISNGDEEIPL